MTQWKTLVGLLGRRVDGQADAGAVIADALVAATDGMVAPAEHDDAAGAVLRSVRHVLERPRRVVQPAGQAVVAALVVLDDRLVRQADPDAVAAVVGLVVAIGVARALGLDAIVVGIRGVVPLEHVAAAGPAGGTQEHAVAAVA